MATKKQDPPQSKKSIRADGDSDDVARLAYEYWETGGHLDGRDLEDWLAAEQEVLRKRVPIAK